MPTTVVVHTATPNPLRSWLAPQAAIRNLWTHRELTLQLAYREVINRYRASWLGLAWTALTPLVLLAIYTFVFAVVFKTRWGDSPDESKAVFALTMFAGMLVFNLFAEVSNRAPRLILDQPNYVKRVVFPLEILIVATVLAAVFNFLVGAGVWVLGWVVIMQTAPPVTLLWLPVVLAPVCLITAGLAWALAAVGVFVRDISHAVVLATQVLFFATPIFYSLERIPAPYRGLMHINPLTHAVVNARRVMMAGQAPDPGYLAISLAFAAVLGLAGYAFFMRSKRTFADVI